MSLPPSFILPDFFEHCPYQYRLSPLVDTVTRNTEEWALTTLDYDENKRARFLKTKGGLLASYCYPDADAFHLQAVSDFMEWLFIFDDCSDDCTAQEAGIIRDSLMDCIRNPHTSRANSPLCQLTKDLTIRFMQSAGPHCARRFVDTVESYLDGTVRQAAYRDRDVIPSVDSYIALRRETSALHPCFVFVEFAARTDLPDEVFYHPVLSTMELAANDWVSWTNDIFSFRKEQAAGEDHNLITVIMHTRRVDLQTAIDQARDMCIDCIKRFEEGRQAVPSWGFEIDHQVQLYVQGLQDTIIGTLHWHFGSKRYFGSNGQELKMSRVIDLTPQFERQPLG